MTTAVRAAVTPAAPASGGVATRTLLQHEWRLLVRDRLLHVAVVLFSVVLVAALVTGARWTAAQRATIGALRATSAEAWAGARRTLDTIPAGGPRPERFARDPRLPFYVGARLGHVATLEPAPLAALAVGQSVLQPPYYPVTTGPRQAMLMKDELEHPATLLTGRLDLAFVVVTLLPLVIGALSYGLVAGEREDGTLALVAAQPVSLVRVILAKVVVRAVVVLGLVLVLVGAGLVVAGVPLGAPGVLALVATWLAAVVCYAAFWFALAVLVGARARSAAAGALMLAAAGLLLVVVVPVLANAVAQARYPAPSRTALITATRATSAAINARADSVLGRYLNDHPELARTASPTAGQDFVARTLSVQFELDTALAPALAAFDARLADQQRLVERARIASPALLVQGILEALAGTDGTRWRTWRDDVVRFHQRWRTTIMGFALRDELLTPRTLAALPQPPVAAADTAVARTVPALAWLVGLAALAWAAALAALRGVRPVVGS